MSSFFRGTGKTFSVRDSSFVNDVPPRPKDLPVWRHDGVDEKFLKMTVASEAARLRMLVPKLSKQEFEIRMNAFKAGVWAGYSTTLKILFNEMDPEVKFEIMIIIVYTPCIHPNTGLTYDLFRL